MNEGMMMMRIMNVGMMMRIMNEVLM